MLNYLKKYNNGDISFTVSSISAEEDNRDLNSQNGSGLNVQYPWPEMKEQVNLTKKRSKKRDFTFLLTYTTETLGRSIDRIMDLLNKLN